MSVTQADIERGLRELGLDSASHVLVHSSYKAFGGVEGGPAAVVRALVDSVATLMMPAFASHRSAVWDERGLFENNAYPAEAPEGWDISQVESFTHDTPANPTMGIINETFRREYDVARSGNPMMSFVAYGPLAHELCGAGTDVDAVEPINRIMEAAGQVLLLGVTHTNSTAVHLAEQLAGRKQFVRYAMTPDGVRMAMSGGCGNPFDDLQSHVQHLERRVGVGASTLRCYDLQPYVETARRLIESDPEALLCPATKSCVRCDAHRSRVPA